MFSLRRFLKTILKLLALTVLFFSICLVVFSYFFIKELEKELPDVKQLHHVQYQIPLNIYSADNRLIARFGEMKRSPVEIEDIPQLQLNAFLAAEDDRFYSHPGVDYQGLLRATVQLLLTGKKRQGGSTITMQVARNFLLNREKTFLRKIKEIILAVKIEQEYSKDKILQLYLNKIYLGQRSYGIGAAAQTYYGKPLDQLDLAQMAMLAGLPKAPSNYNPITDPERALLRRNYVLRRMLEQSFINQTEYEQAIVQPVTATLDHGTKTELDAPYIAEMVRQAMYDQHGEDAYTLGLNVYTTITSDLQTAADHSLRFALHEYDQRHGYRGLPHKHLSPNDEFNADIVGDTQLALITGLSENTARAMLADRSPIDIPWRNISWARPYTTTNYVGASPKSTADLFSVNDLIRVRKLKDNSWSLAQIPETEAAIVALDSQTGAVLALSGGFDFFHNKYNRAIQSKRQPGSGFKPIIYTTALEHGYTAASIINDAPIVIDLPNQESWRPQNYSRKFYGPTRLRTALRKSRNLISIRLLRRLGIKAVTNTAMRFGFTSEQLPKTLSLALGSGHATPMQMARMYAVFANGGFLVTPYFIDRIEDREGKILFQNRPTIACPSCEVGYQTQDNPAPRIITPEVNFLMNSLLRDVVQRGTATRAKTLERTDLAGKTGTTNEQRDAWFNGYAADIVASSWLGFDNSKPLGRGETGGKAALPLWIEFMRTALQGKPEKVLEQPDTIQSAFIDPDTGLLAQPGGNGMREYFRVENLPTRSSPPPTQFYYEEDPGGEEQFFGSELF